MTEREKVIKALECCDNDDCDNCPYFRSCNEDDLGTCRATLHRDALALLKEQEAVEPGIAQDVDGIFATCGNCKKKLWKMMGLEFVVNPEEMPRFCLRCGKAVKWDD